MSRGRLSIAHRSLEEKRGKLVRSKPSKEQSSKAAGDVKISYQGRPKGSQHTDMAPTESDSGKNASDDEPAFNEAEWGFEESGFAQPHVWESNSTSSNQYLKRWNQDYA
ncbi:hypothetical protein FS749_005306, partial [Ceratobasidium sp. UAMH 11750]